MLNVYNVYEHKGKGNFQKSEGSLHNSNEEYKSVK